VWRDLANRGDVHKYELMIFGLREPAFDAFEGNIRLRQLCHDLGEW
jgi:hypothetical protein